MPKLIRYELTQTTTRILPNFWDLVVIVLIFGILALFAWALGEMSATRAPNELIQISLDPKSLPQYAIKTVLRMFMALGLSLLVCFTVAPLAAKNVHFERFIIPFIDIMESLPILSILAIAVAVFIFLFPNSLFGLECAAIFAIFTSQVWNMTLSLYQSLRTVPSELKDAAEIYHLSAWQRFWRVEVPHGMPNLLWNMMISMSSGWFFVVESEAISIAHQEIALPGIGSYVAKAILQADLFAILYALTTMLIVIMLYDQLFFRPLLSWVEKFKPETESIDSKSECWFFNLLAKTKLLKITEKLIAFISDILINHLPFSRKKQTHWLPIQIETFCSKCLIVLFYGALITLVLGSLIFLIDYIAKTVELNEILEVAYLGGITALKVFLLIVIASVIWVPIGVKIGLHPKLTAFFQPLTQILAAFPANLFYPLFVFCITKYTLNANIWTLPLMILGTQWYILFNVIAATANIPKAVKLAARNFGLTPWGLTWWRRLILPALFPSYITGAMSAAGGCWNASIVAEYLSWGSTSFEIPGLGSYIRLHTLNGDNIRLALGTAMMSFYVIVINRLLWHKLYEIAASRFTLESS